MSDTDKPLPPSDHDENSPVDTDAFQASDAIPMSILEDENLKPIKVHRGGGRHVVMLTLACGVILATAVVMLLQGRGCWGGDDGSVTLQPADPDVSTLVTEWIDSGQLVTDPLIETPESIAQILKVLYNDRILIKAISTGSTPDEMKIGPGKILSTQKNAGEIARAIRAKESISLSPIEALTFLMEVTKALGIQSQPALANRGQEYTSSLLHTRFGVLVQTADRTRFLDPWNHLLMAPTEATPLTPKQVEAYTHGLNALGALSSEDLQGANEGIRKALEQDESIPAFWMISGEIKAAMGQKDFALTDMAKAVSIAPDALGYYTLGMAQKEDEAFFKATKSLTKATELNPKLSRAWIALADLQFQRLEFIPRDQTESAIAEAEKYLEKARKLQPNAAALYFQQFQLHATRGEQEEALAMLEKWAEVHPADGQPHQILGQIALQTSDFETANTHLKEALKRDGSDDESRRLLAITYLSLQQWAEAEKELTELLKVQWEDAEIRLELASALFQQGKTDEAKQLLLEQSQRFPKDVQAPMLLTQIYLNEAAFEDAVKYARIIREREDSTDARILEFIALLGIDKQGEAFDELDKIEREQPGSHLIFAEGLLANGAIDALETFLLHALKEFPDQLDLAVMLAITYQITRRPDEADALKKTTLASAEPHEREMIEAKFAEAMEEVQAVIDEADGAR